MKTNDNPDQLFTPLDQAECYRTNGGGGFLGPILGAIAAAIIYEVTSDWDNFKAGLAGKPEIHYD